MSQQSVRDLPPRRSLVLALFVSVELASGAVHAAIPHLIRYQGQAVDQQGVPLEGPYALTFRLYDAETAGTKVWEETQANIVLTGGHFSVLLGQVTPLDVDWSKPLWLSVQVGTEPELSPRQQITSVPLALLAEQLAGSLHIAGEDVGIGTTHPGAKLEVAGNVKIVDGTQGVGKVLTSDANGIASWQSPSPGVPPGAIILWNGASCPAGYTRLTAYDDSFLVSSSTAGQTGGSIAHNHGGTTGSHALTTNEMPSHAHLLPTDSCGSGDLATPVGTDNADESYNPSCATSTSATGGGGGHSHSLSSADHRPPFKTILLCKKD